MGRAPCCDKANVKRGPWSPEEDETLRNYVERNGTVGNWIAMPQKAGLRRCGKSCRLRWLNYLRPNIKHGGFTEEEDNIIYTLFKNIGSRWSVIASHLPGRTDNDVKNYWNTKLKKKLLMAPNSSQETLPKSPITSPQETPSLPPLAPNMIKAEDNFSADPFNWGYSFGNQDSYQFFSEFPLLPSMPEITSATPENSSAASSSIENWSTNGSSRNDVFLSEMGFESYAEFLTGYGEIAKPQGSYHRITYAYRL